jgi:hypothetical protein
MIAPSPGATERHPSVGFRIALTVFLLAGIVWLGAQTARLVVWSELLDPGTIEFNAGVGPGAERMAYAVLAKLFLLLISSYGVLLISSIFLLILSPWPVRQHGWLLMGALLLYLFIPVECYGLYLEGRLAYLHFSATAEPSAMRELFLARAGALAGAPLIGYLCSYTIVLLAVFQPLRRKQTAAP